MRDDEVKLWARQATSWKLNKECGTNPPSLIKDALFARSWEVWKSEGLVSGDGVDFIAIMIIFYAF